MSMPEKIRDFGWFGAGYAVAKGGTDDPDFYPPLNDMEAQREWLGGFGAGWAECPDIEATDSILFGDGTGGESVDEALARALEGRAELLRQLRAYGEERASRTVH
jgi:hypothetical protein